MARTYKRDSRGRFAGGGGGSSSGSRRTAARLPAPSRRTAGSKPQRRRGLLLQRGSLARSQAKLKGQDPADQSIKGTLSRRSQRGAVTRAQKALQAAQQSGRVRLSGRKGVIRAGKGKAEGPKKAAPAKRSGLPSTAIRDRVIPRSRRKLGDPIPELTANSTQVYGRPTNSRQFGTRSIGPDGRVMSRQAVKPKKRKDRRVYSTTNGPEKTRTVVQRMSDGNYAVTRTTLVGMPGGKSRKVVDTTVRTPSQIAKTLRAAVQGARFGGSARVGTKRIGRRIM
jgi:hypothetical protein